MDNVEKWHNHANRKKSMLTPRLKCIISYVNAGVAADIGTDHAYVPIELVRSGRAGRVIATDVRRGPIEIATGHIEKYGMSDRIETRLGAGLSVLAPGEADTIIIAGMGGELIAEILAANGEIARASKLILQPMNSQYELRRYLVENNYIIEHEDIENEGQRVYDLMLVRSGYMDPFATDIDYHIPPYLSEHPKLGMLIDKKEREFKKIIAGLRASRERDSVRLEYYEERLNELERIKIGKGVRDHKNDNSKKNN